MKRTKVGKLLKMMLVVAVLCTCIFKGYARAADAGADKEEVSVNSETSISLQSSDEISVTTAEVEHGTLTFAGTKESGENGTEYVGTAVPDSDYDLATVRLLYQENGEQKEVYADLTENADGSYDYSVIVPADMELSKTAEITATFFSTTVWDGAVDISWYDPDATEYEIGEPAQLAGLAAIVNGMVDDNITSRDMIKGDAAEYINTVAVDNVSLTGQMGGDTHDTVYRLPEVEKDHPLAEDDKYHDMRYRTIKITADIDMGTLNYVPIGGKYSMDTTKSTGDVKTIDTRFQGILDGQGHTITLNCDRYSPKNFANSMAIGLVGYLGGGVGKTTDGGKDVKESYAREWVPTVRNIVVKGTMRGRRMVGGIVGRTGQTNYGILVENCANYADVSNTDKRGCAGIVGAAWGYATIRNCYNAGTISADYYEVGGIVGSNGMSRESANIYNCYNVGTVTMEDEYNGREIGTDATAGGYYTVSNCYYLAPQEGQQSSYEGYANTGNALAKIVVQSKTKAEMLTQEFCDLLNTNGNAFVMDTKGLNNGYPVLFFQNDPIDVEDTSKKECRVTIESAEHGTIASDKTEIVESGVSVTLPYGTTITFSSEADQGYVLRNYTINGEKIQHDYYTVTEDIEVSGVFAEVTAVSLLLPESDKYEVQVTRIYDAGAQATVSETLENGSLLNEGDIITVKGILKEGAEPDDVDLEYTGEFDAPIVVDSAAATVDNLNNQKFTVTGEGDVEIEIVPNTRGKQWTSIADTSWYDPNETTFTITTARQLAGVAKILYDEIDSFEGKTILLGNDIDLANTDGTGGMRNWSVVGGINRPFKGTFDGQNHTIRNMYRNFHTKYGGGSYGGLFAALDSATVKNVTVEGTFTRAVVDSGAIAGAVKDSQIINCTSKVVMDAAKTSGGIAGGAEGSTKIQNCINKGKIEGTSSVAGIVGEVETDESSDVQILSCRNEAEISVSSDRAAGIVAECQGKTTISQCVNTGKITASHNTICSSTYSVGGIVGTIIAAAEITRCVNSGEIRAENCVCSAAGIAGFISNTKVSVAGCYNTGNIYSEGKLSTAVCVAGIANTSSRASVIPTVSNCYSIGRITIGSEFQTNNYGGCIGYGNEKNTNISNNYCLNTSVSAIGGTAGIFGEVVTAAKLKTMAATLGSDFVRDVKNVNGGYPVLLWQYPENEESDTIAASVTLSSVKSKSFSSIALSWTKNGTATGYEVYRSTGKNSSYNKIQTIKSADTTSLTDSGLTCGKTYYYKVRAYRTVSGVRYYGNYSSVKSAKTALDKTTVKKLQNVKGKTVQITWKKVSGANGYEVYRSLKKTKNYKKAATIKKGGTVTWKDQKLIRGKMYYYKVRAYRTVSGKKVYSSWSNIKSVKVKK